MDKIIKGAKPRQLGRMHHGGATATLESARAITELLAMIESISAITLATHNMPRAVRFYRMLGFEIVYGGDDATFTSFHAGTSYLNLIAQPAERTWSWWGRVAFYHSNVDSSMRAWSRPATIQIRHRAMPNGASGSST